MNRIVDYFGSICLCIRNLVEKLFHGIEPKGWASMIVMVLFLGGVQLLMLGVLGEYIGRIFDETKGRPNYIVARTRNLD